MNSLRENEDLGQFAMEDVVPTDRRLGSGSYGSVIEVRYQHTLCAAKQLHGILLEEENEGVANVAEKFLEECRIMSNLRHPNITQFLGLFFAPDSPLPLLVMEKLEMNLDHLLTTRPDLQLSSKLSILEDICRGLVYLHGRRPPVIHRDLTSRNVLLNSAMKAKLTDMGNSRIVDLLSGEPLKTLTRLPGTLVYMPPEAVGTLSRYGKSLDVFSFGHLALFVLIQVFPRDLEASTYTDADNPNITIARTEVDRRRRYMEMLEGRVGPVAHLDLYDLLELCLHNAPHSRPATLDLLLRVQEVRARVEAATEEGDEEQQQGVPNLLSTNERRLRERCEAAERRASEMARRASELERQLQNRDEDRTRGERRISELEAILQSQHELSRRSQSERNDLDDKLKAREKEMKTATESRVHLEDLCREKEFRIKDLEVQLKNTARNLNRELKDKKIVQEIKIEWSAGPDAAFSVDSVKHVVTMGNEVYLMVYNYAALGSNSTKISMFNTDTKTWRSLPPFDNLRGSAMVAMNDQIAVVGGHFEARKIPLLKSKEKALPFTAHNITTWEKSKQGWKPSDVKLPNGIFNCAAVVYKHWLIVIGYGKDSYEGDQAPLLVQMLDCDTNQWFIRLVSCPVPMKNMFTLLVGDTWHLMSRSHKHCEKIHCMFLPALIVHVTKSVDSSMWTIMDNPHQFSSLLYLEERLLLVGGAITPDGCYTPISTILCYNMENERWELIGNLPFPISKCVCTVTPSGSFQIIGGLDWKDYRKFLDYSNSMVFLKSNKN